MVLFKKKTRIITIVNRFGRKVFDNDKDARLYRSQFGGRRIQDEFV